ncbi:MAG: hypothetical protein D6683_14690 [Actinomyces sp.]|nr:MAG: hypothetical protein D6683_14690 [Actinomyces sp.]
MDNEAGHGDMAGMDNEAGHGDMAGMDHEAGHDHEHTALTEWPADVPLPEVAVSAEPHDDGSLSIHIDLNGFEFADPTEHEATAPRGHVHVNVDGREVGMYFEPDIELADVGPGDHTVSVTLAAADHSLWARDGEPLGASTEVTIAGEVTPADDVIEVAVGPDGAAGGIVEAQVGLGDTVEVRIDSSVAEEFHLHTYDVSAELEPGQVTTVRFTADIPGVFEAELEGAGIQVLELTVS